MFFKFLLIFSLSVSSVLALEKSPSDVYSESLVLQKMVVDLRKQNGLKGALPKVERQRDRLPRHVLQKTLEILAKVNKYREIKGLGEITLPPVPSREITPQDVYYNVVRLKKEVGYLFSDKKKLHSKRYVTKHYSGKTPSDVYRVLWSISLGFDRMIGRGFTPTDVYILSEQIVQNIKFLRASQHENAVVSMPVLQSDLHPNHALYQSIKLIAAINQAQRKLWMTPVPVPKKPHKVISPTEVYDSLQTVNAELNRISQRLGVERYFAPQAVDTQKTPSDVVQNLEYARALLPTFNFSHRLNQYPSNSLIKTPNDVFALSEYILEKIANIKAQKGIRTKAKQTRYIYGLKPIHVYVKGIEALEKVQKLKKIEGFKPSESPEPPNKKITPSEVYELILRLDDEISLAFKDSGMLPYRELVEKKSYRDKTPSDAYDNLWKISYALDTILNQEYTPNETYILAKKVEFDVAVVAQHFLQKKLEPKIQRVHSKRPSDVFEEVQKLQAMLQKIKKRANLASVKITIPKDRELTPTSVYNALRIVSATLSEIHVAFGMTHREEKNVKAQNKTPSDVYSVVQEANRILAKVFEDSSYAH